jgi:hypothetical protein
VDGVVTWCTPLLHDPDEAPRALHDKAPGLGWIGVPGRLSRTLCTQLCTRPWLAQWLYVLLYPRLPVGLARQFTQRIQRAWSSYAPTMEMSCSPSRPGGRHCARWNRRECRCCTPSASVMGWRRRPRPFGSVRIPRVDRRGARDC